MRAARSILLAILLAAGALSPPRAESQEPRAPPGVQEARGFRLGANYPDPVNPETWIPFFLEESLFAARDTGIVTLRIVNVLGQVIAVPIMWDPPQVQNRPVLELPFTEPGRKTAYWDGKDTAGRRVPSGVYYCRLTVNGETQVRKLVVKRPRRGLIPWFGRDRGRSR